jgi:UTP-glucose-1-phosphate uridylyltransferase
MLQHPKGESMKLLEKLSESVEKSESFRQIMNDGIVEESEIEAQGKLVESLIEKLENQLSESDFKLVSDLISELSVFQLISNYR